MGAARTILCGTGQVSAAAGQKNAVYSSLSALSAPAFAASCELIAEIHQHTPDATHAPSRIGRPLSTQVPTPASQPAPGTRALLSRF